MRDKRAEIESVTKQGKRFRLQQLHQLALSVIALVGSSGSAEAKVTTSYLDEFAEGAALDFEGTGFAVS